MELCFRSPPPRFRSRPRLNQKLTLKKIDAEAHAKGLVHRDERESLVSPSEKVSFRLLQVSLPARESLRGRVGEVENQGQCGSCWDFSLTATLRGTYMSLANDPGRLSYNYLLNCSQEQNGCGGGDFSAAKHLLAPLGAPTSGSDGIYTAVAGACVKKAVAASAVQFHLLGEAAHAPSFKDLATVIAALKRPVTVDIVADGNFEAYAGGVFNSCISDLSKETDHMVTLEGYDCETSVDQDGNCVFDENGNLPAGVGLWVIRNSWGTDWGDSGYVTMKATNAKGQRCNKIADQALYFDIPLR